MGVTPKYSAAAMAYTFRSQFGQTTIGHQNSSECRWKSSQCSWFTEASRSVFAAVCGGFAGKHPRSRSSTESWRKVSGFYNPFQHGAGLQSAQRVDTAMKDAEIERWPFAVLACVCLGGLMLKACAFGQYSATLDGVVARTCSDLLVFLGGVGSAGLLCVRLFGPARVESTLFWGNHRRCDPVLRGNLTEDMDIARIIHRRRSWR